MKIAGRAWAKDFVRVRRTCCCSSTTMLFLKRKSWRVGFVPRALDGTESAKSANASSL
jgi:hypothetical protein